MVTDVFIASPSGALGRCAVAALSMVKLSLAPGLVATKPGCKAQCHWSDETLNPKSPDTLNPNSPDTALHKADSGSTAISQSAFIGPAAAHSPYNPKRKTRTQNPKRRP